MIMVPLFLVALAAALSALMAAAWLVVERGGRSGWIDATWSFATGAAGVAAALAPLSAGTPSRRWMVAALVALWSLRLGIHIARRTWRGGEDPRYAALRAEWGADRSRRLFWFLQSQAAAGFLLVVAVMAAAHAPGDWPRPGDLLGLAVALAAVLGEAMADHQLARFRAEAANGARVCDVGLWGWSRHPNYFFEWLGWTAYALIGIDLSGAWPWGWLTLAAPALMYWLLVHVSGIPPLEAHMLRSRGAAFRAYQARVGAFWPWPGR